MTMSFPENVNTNIIAATQVFVIHTAIRCSSAECAEDQELLVLDGSYAIKQLMGIWPEEITDSQIEQVETMRLTLKAFYGVPEHNNPRD